MKPWLLVAAISTAAAPVAHAGYEEAAAALGRGEAVAAMRELQPLADKGDVRATKLLASLFGSGGKGLVADPMRAMQLYRRAAEAGDAESQYALGRGYALGTGLLRSPNQAYYWLSIAAANANPNDRAAWEREREAAGQTLTAAERDHLREAAFAFLGRPAPTRERDPILPTQLAPPPAKGKAGTTSGRSAGSGIVVTRDGKILTNAHVVPKCETIGVTFADGIRRNATLLARDDLNDLALLEAPARDLQVAHFRDGKAVRSGEGVVAVGFPLSSMLSSEANVTVGVVSALAGRKGDGRFLQVTAPIQKGNSGGPLADMSGTVIGVVTASLDAVKIAERTGAMPQNVNFAVKADVAREFLGKNKVPVQTAMPGPDLSAADVGEAIKRATVFVECDQRRVSEP